MFFVCDFGNFFVLDLVMGCVLVTGFEPWADWPSNPSGEIAKALDGVAVAGHRVVSAILPVVHGEDITKVAPLLAKHRPVAVVSLGLHGGASVLHVERVAVNLKVVDGEDHPVVTGGPDAYFATVPTRDMVSASLAVGIPARLTYSAGTFLCNHIMYSVLHHIAVNGLGMRAGFIHLPPTPDMVVQLDSSKASMALSDMHRGVVACLEAVVKSVSLLAV